MQFAAENSQLIGSLVAVIRSASQLNAQDIGFVRTLDRNLRKSSVSQSQRLLGLIGRLVTHATGEECVLANLDDLKAKWSVVDRAFDVLVDRADHALAGPSESRQSSPAISDSSDVVTHEKSLARPQNKFADDIDNTVGPFKPKLTSKPHAVVPLAESTQIQPADGQHAHRWYDQPYRVEIEQARYPSAVSTPSEPVRFRDWAKTPLTLVNTPKALKKMVDKLAKAPAIAVDLEHHDLRSYLGLLCLMQISTTKEDFIVDTLALRTELQILNSVFCDPKIVKVFHGAYMDVQWLQRDLGVYVVSLFDTYHASRALGFAKHSLAFLLEKYADFVPSKQYQRADWRVRPLGPELTDYARADTHFLLYIYDCLRNELLEAGKLDGVLDESRRTAAKRYEKPGMGSEPGWLKLAVTHKLNAQQSGVLAKLYQWRDAKARLFDESPGYVMNAHLMASMAAVHPTTAGTVVSVSNRIPPLVRQEAEIIARLISDALDHPIDILSFAPPPPEQLDLFSDDALARVRALRLAKPLVYSDVPAPAHPPAAVYLGVFKMDDLPKTEAEPAEVEAVEAVEAVPSPEPAAESESEAESEKEVLVVPKSRKRKIKVVQNLDDVKLEATLSNKRVLADEDAFDFEAAAPVAQERAAPTFSQFRSKLGGPRGARGPRRVPQGRSKTFRR